MTTATPVLAQQFASPSLLKNITLAILGSLAIWVSAKIQIPFYPVPMTMQVFVILAIGAAFGSRLGVATVLLYLAEGAAGLPVFALIGAGPAYIAGPTGGYLIGFVVAAFITGSLAERGWDRNFVTTAIAMLLGLAAIYALGLLWLAAPLTAVASAAGSSFAGIGFETVIAKGLEPFIIADLVKVALATALFPMIWKMIGKH